MDAATVRARLQAEGIAVTTHRRRVLPAASGRQIDLFARLNGGRA